MTETNTSSYPGGSRKRVNIAGENLRNRKKDYHDIKVLDEWRAAHRPVLNTFQAILRNRTKGTDIVVAQRHKRKHTIIDKLTRYPQMKLARMDDVAGCRLIFRTLEDLYRFRKEFHNARFGHDLKNSENKYDYIKSPKQTGYRGVHDVYSYNVNSSYGSQYKGLLIEIQYRTLYQHAWATAVEVVGFITKNQPKFERGDGRFLEIFRFASEIIARTFEKQKSCLADLSDKEVVENFNKLNSELSFLRILKGLNAADKEISERKNVILIFERDELEIRIFPRAPKALQVLFELERESPSKDIVLVRADTGEDIKLAFRNYFSDATDFIDMIDKGRRRLLRSSKSI